ncbi:ATP-binding protein [Corynebacterium sp. NPDC060344]|uniref:sensor histidine kinase n=1 Tax=Corynebacterium sp. NPDC060344 TaxID=3347101 RepID=UPI00365867D0
MPDTRESRDRPPPAVESDPHAPPPNAFRPLPGNMARPSGGAPTPESPTVGAPAPESPAPGSPTSEAPAPTAETFAHRITVGIVAPLFGARILVELPALIEDVRRGHRHVVPLTLAQIALVAAPAVATAHPDPSAFRRTAALATIASWPVAAAASASTAAGARVPGLTVGWVAGITSTLASVSSSHWAAALNAVAQGSYIGVVKHGASRNRGAASLFSACVMPAAISLPFVFLAQAMILRAREHDAIARSTAASAIATARLSAANAEATRFNALLHDQVLAVLKAVKNDVPPADVRRIATGALRLTQRAAAADDGAAARRMTGLAAGLAAGFDPDRAPGAAARVKRGVAAEDLDRALRRVVLEATPDCRIRSTAHGPPVPADVASALESALRQTAGNSARHAGEGVTRTCDISIRADGIDLAYADDGRGFDPADVPHDRLGLRTSIRDRMLSLDGATVRIDSRPGAGTTVEFEWTPEPTEAIPVSIADDVVTRTPLSVLVGAAITTQMLLEKSTAAHPIAAAAGWALGMAGFHVQRLTPKGRPSIPRTAAIVGLTSAGTLIPALADARTSNPSVPAWHEYSFALALSLVGARGRPWLATGTSLLWLAGTTARGRRSWTGLSAATHVPGIVFSGAIARLALHAVNRRIEWARMTERRLLDLVGQRHAENRVREANRTWLDDVAGAFLRRIRHVPGEAFTADDRTMAGLLDARIRDSLRSPRLDRPDITALAWDLRVRGLTVLLVDDRGPRGGAECPAGLLDEVAGAFADIADHVAAAGISDGRLTVRLLPPGRSSFATIVLSPDAAEPRRVSIAY